MKYIGFTLAVAGVLLILGAAGASDAGTMGLTEAILRCAAGFILAAMGGRAGAHGKKTNKHISAVGGCKKQLHRDISRHDGQRSMASPDA